MATKLTTVIVNQTTHGLVMKVGHRHHFAKLASVKLGGEYKMQVDLNWTYQEFLLEDSTDSSKKLNVNSDDCCDYERITVREVNGKLDVHREPRKQFAGDSAVLDATPLSILKLAKSTWRWFWLLY